MCDGVFCTYYGAIINVGLKKQKEYQYVYQHAHFSVVFVTFISH